MLRLRSRVYFYYVLLALGNARDRLDIFRAPTVNVSRLFEACEKKVDKGNGYKKFMWKSMLLPAKLNYLFRSRPSCCEWFRSFYIRFACLPFMRTSVACTENYVDHLAFSALVDDCVYRNCNDVFRNWNYGMGKDQYLHIQHFSC